MRILGKNSVSPKKLIAWTLGLYMIALVGAYGLGLIQKAFEAPTNAPLAIKKNSWEKIEIDYRYHAALRFEKSIDHVESELKSALKKHRSVGNLNQLARLYVEKAKTIGTHKLQHKYFYRAKRLSLESLKIRENNVQALLLLARIYEGHHNFAKAEYYIEEAKKQKPFDLEMLHLKFTIQLALGQYQKALGTAKILYSKIPSMGASLALAQAYQELGDDGTALHYYEEAFLREDIGDSKGSLHLRLMFGKFAVQAGRFAVAEAVYSSALKIAPKNAQARESLGDLAFERKSYQEAMAQYKVAYQLKKSYTLEAKIARVKMRNGDAQAGKRLLDKAIVRAKHFVRHHRTGHEWELAQILLWRGTSADLAEAEILLNRELKVRKSNLVRELLDEAKRKQESGIASV